MTHTTNKLNILIKWAEDNNIPEDKLSRDAMTLFNQTTLNLHNMNLSYLPKEIGALSNLENLYVSYNSLIELPIELYNLTNLNTLWIQGNKLTKIDNFILNLTNLETIQAYDNNINTIPDTLNNLEHLLIFTLYYNDFTEASISKYELLYDDLVNTKTTAVNKELHLKELKDFSTDCLKPM